MTSGQNRCRACVLSGFLRAMLVNRSANVATRVSTNSPPVLEEQWCNTSAQIESFQTANAVPTLTSASETVYLLEEALGWMRFLGNSVFSILVEALSQDCMRGESVGARV